MRRTIIIHADSDSHVMISITAIGKGSGFCCDIDTRRDQFPCEIVLPVMEAEDERDV